MTSSTTRDDQRGSRWRVGFGATLTLAMAVGTLFPFVLGVLAPFIVSDLGLSRARFGSLTSVYYLVGIVGSLVIGFLVDRVGGRRMLVVLFVTGGVSLVVLAGAPGYLVLALGAFFGGLSTAGVNPVTNQLMAAFVPRGRQGILVGVKQSGVYVGSFLVGAGLPVLAEAFGWRTAIATATTLAAVGLALTLAFVPPHEPPTSDTPAADAPRADVRGLVGLAIATLLIGTGVAAAAVYLALYAFEALGFSASAAGLVVALSALVTVVARIVWGRSAERRGDVGGLLVVLAVLSVASLSLVLAAEAVGGWLLWVGALAVGLSGNALNAVVMLAIVRDADPAVTGRASGVIQLAFYIGMLITPIGFGWLVDLTGSYVPGWASVTIAGALAVPVLLHWNRRRRTVRTPAEEVAA